MKEDIKKSSDNLYADFGYKNPEEMQAKAVLAQTIYRNCRNAPCFSYGE